MADASLSLGEPADESDWRALVEKGLKGASWDKLVAKTADGVAIQPLYREPDIHTALDVSGMPGAAPFIRGRAGWMVRQSFAHPEPEQTNREILADLAGGVSGIELAVDPEGEDGVAIRDARDLDIALADVILEAAPVSLDAGVYGLRAAELLEQKLKGVAAPGTAFNVDPIGAMVRTGEQGVDAEALARFAQRLRHELPAASALRVDARPVHEAGGTEAQEIACALSSGIAYLRMIGDEANSGASLQFAVAVGPDVLVEAAKLRALRLCWARVMEAFGAAPEQREARIHAFTSRRMLTRYDAYSNILRITTAAFGAAVGGANFITTSAMTDAIGLPTPFARRVARNTQHVLLEEARLGHVADPAGGAWFIEKLTRDLAAQAWGLMQRIEGAGGIIAALQSGLVQSLVGEARSARAKLIATRRQTITGVTDFPLLGAKAPDVLRPHAPHALANTGALAPIRLAEPFERLRDRTEAMPTRPHVFFANLGALPEFSPRALYAQNFLAAGGVDALGSEDAYASLDALLAAFKKSGARAAILTGTDAAYADRAAECASALKSAGAVWVLLAGRPGDNESAWRSAGVDQFIFMGVDAVAALETLHVALGLTP